MQTGAAMDETTNLPIKILADLLPEAQPPLSSVRLFIHPQTPPTQLSYICKCTCVSDLCRRLESLFKHSPKPSTEAAPPEICSYTPG